MKISKAAILEQVRNQQLSPEEGLKLYRKLGDLPMAEEVDLPTDDEVNVDSSATEKSTPTAVSESVSAVPDHSAADIAVIGMSGQMPGATSLDAMWALLSEGRNMVDEIPLSRWGSEVSDTSDDGTSPKWGAFLSDIDCFDPLFFEISPMEAEQMDPQQRLLLQESWKAFENAGYSADSLDHQPCCVFVGCSQGDYLSGAQTEEINPHSLTGRSVSAMAARISYFFNLHGPSITVNTACSSSLTALVMACERLRNGDSDMGLVAGVSLMSTPAAHTTMNEVGMISTEGKCRTFDQEAQGIVPGEAIGVVILKRLQDALADGDQVHGVLRGYGINHDGKTNGLTAPSGPAQTSLLLDIYKKFDVNPSTINYIEAHGTGTKLGDPIEVHALIDAFDHYQANEHQCALGSIKTNIGHTLEAAGLMGLFKILLCLQKQKRVPSLHFNKANEHIAFADSPFYVNTKLEDWPRIDDQPLRAGVSAFGMSGTNAHVIVEESPLASIGEPAQTDNLPLYLILLSGKTATALEQRIDDLSQWLSAHEADSTFSLLDVAYTLQVGRTHFAYREALVVRSVEELQQRLQESSQHAADAKEIVVPTGSEFKLLKQQAIETLASLAASTNDQTLYQSLLLSLSDYYKQGIPVDWQQIYPRRLSSPRRIVLPNYPFAKQRYWLYPENTARRDSEFETPVSIPENSIHPLLQQNTSCLSEQRYTTRFSGTEFFLADHQVRSEDGVLRKVLPVAVYLEMARAAVLAATGFNASEETLVRLNDIVCLEPLYVDQPCAVHIKISEETEELLCFEIYTEVSGAQPRVVHGKGRALRPQFQTMLKPPKLELVDLRRPLTESLDISVAYQRIHAEGMEYGERLRIMQRLSLGNHQLIADLSLPELLERELSNYVLHPSMLDAAIQAAITLVLNENIDNSSQQASNLDWLFALEQVDILGRCEADMVIRLLCAPESSSGIQKWDVDVCDIEGNVRVAIKGLSSQGWVRKKSTNIGAVEDEPDRTKVVESSLAPQMSVADNRLSEPVSGKDSALESSEELLREKSTDYLKERIANILKMDPKELDPAKPLEVYGIDSILVVQLHNDMSKDFKKLSSTLFFDVETLEALVDHFLETQRETLITLLGFDSTISEVSEVSEVSEIDFVAHVQVHVR